MASPIRMRHKESGLTKVGRYGFSWTYLFFGWFVPLFRGELGVAALHFFFTMISFGLFQIILAFLYNKQYMTRMLTQGWELHDTESEMKRAEYALGIFRE